MVAGAVSLKTSQAGVEQPADQNRYRGFHSQDAGAQVDAPASGFLQFFNFVGDKPPFRADAQK
jgi:hypothetical protein